MNLVVVCILLAGAAVAIIFATAFFMELIVDAKRSKQVDPDVVETAEKVSVKAKEIKETKVEEIDLDAMLASLEKKAKEVEKKEEKKEEPVKIVENTVVIVPKEEKKEEPKPESKIIEKNTVIVLNANDESSKLDYDARLEKLKESFAKLEKDIAKNTKELNKYGRTKRRKERNEKLLNKKAGELTNLNLVLYNINKLDEVDPEKKKKQEELVAHIAELKVSIIDAEEYLAKNKEKNNQAVKLSSYLAKEKEKYENEIKDLEQFVAKTKKLKK